MDDIKTRHDIEKLVTSFYERIQSDDLLKPVFQHVDWPKHLPTMFNFWSSLLLGDRSYDGNPFQKHVHLSINADHFTRWLELWTETVDLNFRGVKADEVKERARGIAGIFQHKLGLKPN